MCIAYNPGRSIKLETLRRRFLVDLLKFPILLLISDSGGETCVGGCQGRSMPALQVDLCLPGQKFSANLSTVLN